MPFHKIGENVSLTTPSTLRRSEIDSFGISNDVINRWFEDAFLPLQNDPYIHIKMDDPAYSQLLTAVTAGKRDMYNVTDISEPIQAADLQTRRKLFELSREGQLFYYDPSLGEAGAMRQLYTRSVQLDGKEDFELCVTGAVHKLLQGTEPPEPKSPSWVTYVKAFFGSEAAKDKIQNYKDQVAAVEKYEWLERMDSAFENGQDSKSGYVETRRDGTLLTAFRGVKEERAERIKVYEEALKNTRQEKKPEVTRGMKRYDQLALDKTFSYMTYKDNSIPKNNLGIDGAAMGMLVTMALASPDLSIKISKNNDRQQNEPDVTYAKAVDTYLKNQDLGNGKTAGFRGKAKNAVLEGIEIAEKNGDFSKLGKLIAQGLTQNNKVLMGCRQLDDRFTTYATIGTRVLKMLDANADLKKATLEALGGDTKQLDMANAAKNINNLRVEVMPLYENMLRQFGETVPKTYIDKKDGVEKVRYDNAAMGNTRDLAKVIQLFNIEVSMNAGNFDLQTTEYAKNGVVEKYNQELDKSSVLISFLAGENRVETLKNPMKMKELYVNASNERKQVAEELKQAALEMAKENQPKEQNMAAMPQ